MYEAVLFLTEGFEEMEAVAPIDILRRGGVELVTVSLTGDETVTGSHGIPIRTDMLFDATAFKPGQELLILPGGPGTAGYKKHERLLALLTAHHNAGGRLAAICAAPSILGGLGILNGKTACCYPGYEAELAGAAINYDNVVTDCCLSNLTFEYIYIKMILILHGGIIWIYYRSSLS
jgi:4-methyl-5(b-hydroxyethyl)-thiazole monophosphate biosynthesis